MTTVAVDTGRLEAAGVLAERLRREIVACLRSSDRLDDVYQLEIGLYPVTTLHVMRAQAGG